MTTPFSRPTDFLPSRRAAAAGIACALLLCSARILGLSNAITALAAVALCLAALAWAGFDLAASARAWRAAPLRIERRWPQALALGVRHVLELTLVNPGPRTWTLTLFDDVDPDLDFENLPMPLVVPPAATMQLRYTVIPRRRGAARFGPAQLRVRSLGGAFDGRLRLGDPHALRVFPNFAAVAGYAWLAGDRRLTQAGFKSYIRRGTGTDFKQLAEYRPGDAVRHIDWKATLRRGKPIVREFEDNRDQCVLFLLDCGRRMRADDSGQGTGGSHFDQALNALMLLSYVALKEGDEVGTMTFGTPAGGERRFAPRNGAATLNALMAHLYDVEPTPTYSDYQVAAQNLMRVHRKRALVIIITNFRDEDAAELKPALRLLRSRHLVLLASLRETATRELAAQPLRSQAQAIDVAGAHLFEQARRDAFVRLVGDDPLAIDVEPAQLAVSLVNHYHAVKRARLL